MNLFVKASGSAIPYCTFSSKVASSTNVSMQLLIALGATPPRLLTISVIRPISCHLSKPCINWLIGIVSLAIHIEWLLSSVGSVGIVHIPVILLSVPTSLSLEVRLSVAMVERAIVVSGSSHVASIWLSYDGRSSVSRVALLLRRV